MFYWWNDETCKCTEKDNNKMANDASKTITDSAKSMSDIFTALLKTLLSDGASQFEDSFKFIQDNP